MPFTGILNLVRLSLAKSGAVYRTYHERGQACELCDRHRMAYKRWLFHRDQGVDWASIVRLAPGVIVHDIQAKS